MTDGESPASTELIAAVAERLKFFFSDANVRQDRFMRNRLLRPHDNVEKGYIPIEVLLKFNSIKNHTEDSNVIVQAAKTLSDVLVLNKDETAIGRVEPFSMSMMNNNLPLTLYVKNVPVEAPEDDGKSHKYAVSMEDVRALFESYGKIALVKLRFKVDEQAGGEDADAKSPSSRRKKPTIAAGSAFIEFEAEEDLQKAAADVLTIKNGEAVEPKRKLTLGDNTLEVVTMQEWVETKKEKDEKKTDETGESPKKRDREDEPAAVEFKLDWKPGSVIQLTGLSESCDREAILAAVADGLGITVEAVKDQNIYADFSRGQTNGAIRFNTPSEATSELASKLAKGEVKIAGGTVESAKIIEGEEEIKYWNEFIKFKNKQMKHRAEERAMKKKRHHHH